LLASRLVKKQISPEFAAKHPLLTTMATAAPLALGTTVGGAVGEHLAPHKLASISKKALLTAFFRELEKQADLPQMTDEQVRRLAAQSVQRSKALRGALAPAKAARAGMFGSAKKSAPALAKTPGLLGKMRGLLSAVPAHA